MKFTNGQGEHLDLQDGNYSFRSNICEVLFLPAITLPISNFSLIIIKKPQPVNLRRKDVINMKYIEEALQNLTGEMLFVFMDRLIMMKMHSPVSRGNQQTANKATVEDTVYKQWKKNTSDGAMEVKGNLDMDELSFIFRN